MSDDKKETVNRNTTVLRVVPFTGLLFTIWAFFDPSGYGRWMGSIVRAFRDAAGL